MTGDVILVATPTRWRRLPLVTITWLDERPRDACGRPRSPATMPGFRKGKAPGNKGKRYAADPLTPEEVQLLIAGCSRSSATGLRNRALIVVLWRSGLRISEALALLPGDIDHDAHTVLVRHGKGDKMRRVGIDARALVYVREWEAARRKLGVTAYEPLFCTINQTVRGGPVRSPYVRMLLKRLAVEAGITKRVHPHGLRHSLACDLSREKVPLALIQRQLGHNNPGTTGIYLQGISNHEVVEAMAIREWGS